MPRENQEIPNETAGFVSDLAGLPSFLIDPDSAAKRVHSKWFWIVPLIVTSVIAITVGIYLAPIILHVTEVAPLPDGMTPEQHQQAVKVTGIMTKVFTYLSPIFSLIIWAILAGVLLAVSSVAGVKARFGALFNLVAGCWIIQSLAGVASAIILHFKGEVSTAAELKPPMGPDIFLPEGANKYLVAAAGSFSIFSIWWIVMMALVLAAAFRVSKGKAFAMVLPLWIFGMLMAMVGAAFQR